ncbi:hypothetical protein M408DRAFT_329844 [Serendipita vermifera MAFF 305830]|uniref:54S ribosomal protein L24, mitochondrial n=1 Tax=Serendipita vermifera MAFF 305830 TaxID=933852 RepID=A0A0C3B706_SERVB|nr:hypothetical protein M408DRAFT_329844 [Serendipita vermifera MAFF 305830]
MRPSLAFKADINTATKIKHAQHLFKRAQEGIFHGRAIRFGHNVPESGQTTARTWVPNVQPKKMKSDILDRTMRWNVTARAMRTMKKYGSLDKYVLGVRTKWLGDRAMWLRSRLQDEMKKKEAIEAASLEEGETIVQMARPRTQLEKKSDMLLRNIPKKKQVAASR